MDNMNVNNNEMRVTKRNGELEEIAFDKILNRVKKLGIEANIQINYSSLTMKVIDQLYDTIPTTKIDELAAEQCASLSTLHPDYGVLASRIVVSNHHKNTDYLFSNVMMMLYNFKDVHNNNYPLISKNLWNFTTLYSKEIDDMINHERDYLIDYFGFKTLERAYLFKYNNKIVERPQHMWMRVAIGIHGDLKNENALALVKETYDLMSQKYFTHATPTLFNAGTPRPQLSSCYLIAMEDDSLDGIYSTLKDCALISKWAGGIGLHIHNVRAKDTHIKGTNGTSNGLVPMLRVFNNTARYCDQCVVPETIIYTTNGPIEIQHCSLGETKIFNLRGTCETIENVLEHPYEGDIYNIETMHCIDNLKITPDHPIYVLKDQKVTNYNVIKNRLDHNIIDFEWIEAKFLNKRDMLVYKIPHYDHDIETLNEDDCYMYGAILGDGSMCNKDQNGYLSLHTINKKHIIDFAVNYFQNKCIQYKIDVDENTTRIRWNKSINLPFRYNDFYDINKNKYIHSKWLNLPINKSKFILKGLLDTDGCNNKELVFDNTSRNLIESARFICLKMGVLTSGYIRDRIGESHATKKGFITNKKISYCLRIPKTSDICKLMNIDYNEKQFFKFFRYNDLLLSRIKNITMEKYEGTLYDLQMKEEHTYMIHNGIIHNGGGKRNGSFAIYLEPWHPDIYDFLELRKNHGDEELKARDLFYALWISDLFMERVKEKNGKWSLFCPHECPGLSDVYGKDFVDLYTKYESEGRARKVVEARDLWFKILDAQMETGTPYILYKDSVNMKSNQKNLGTIKSSNLCVAPETLILTDKGHIEIQTLEGQQVNVWNGEEFSQVDIIKTGTDQDLLDVYTDDGSKLTCTPYHKFYIQETYLNNSIKIIQAKDLTPNDKLIKCDFPLIDGNDTFLYPYTHGFFCGDGTYSNISENEEKLCNYNALNGHFFCKRHIDYETENYLLNNNDCLEDISKCQAKSYCKKPMAYLYHEKKDLLQFMNYRTYTENKNRLILQLPLDIEEKFNIPSFNCSIKDKLDWFAGYCDADGSISRNGDNEQLQVASINYIFLQNIKLLLQTCGINPKIRLSQIRDKSYLPDGKGGHKYYDVKPIYRLLITSFDLYNLFKLGFSPKRLKITGNEPSRNANQFIKILKIENNNRIDDTYCFTEPKKHMGIFNGIITGQCTEITEYSDKNETAVCNLASIALPLFVDPVTKYFDYNKLHAVTKVVTNNLNRVIDINFYPTEKTKRSNLKHRPIGIGVQGLADTFILMDVAFHSEQAKEINRLIFETMYHAALEKSNELAIERRKNCKNNYYLFLKEQLENNTLNFYDLDDYKFTREEIENLDDERCGSYSSFIGSPASQGILQYDMWSNFAGLSNRYDWASLKQSIMKNGLRNSLLIAPMPTASTSQILGFNECFEPLTSNIYSRRTLAGEFVVVNKYLMKELIEMGLWNEQIKNNIVANKGSVQQLTILPEHIRNKYKIVWEIPMKHLIDMSAERGAFICQSQSLNLWMEDPVYNKLTSMHFYAWEKGLKTGIYYLRRKAKHQAQQFTIEPEKKVNNQESEQEDICTMCSA
jgi:ribonucleoside-diphosphate reductase alpha chain